MFEFEACEVLKTKEFTVVNDCFQNEHNEKIGHYRQTLFNHIRENARKKNTFIDFINGFIAHVL